MSTYVLLGTTLDNMCFKGSNCFFLKLKMKVVSFKTNFKKKFSKLNMFCRLCKDDSKEKSEMHLLKCAAIVKETCLKNLNTVISYLEH